MEGWGKIKYRLCSFNRYFKPTYTGLSHQLWIWPLNLHLAILYPCATRCGKKNVLAYRENASDLHLYTARQEVSELGISIGSFTPTEIQPPLGWTWQLLVVHSITTQQFRAESEEYLQLEPKLEFVCGKCKLPTDNLMRTLLLITSIHLQDFHWIFNYLNFSSHTKEWHLQSF